MIIEAGYDIVELLINEVANRRNTNSKDAAADENPLWVLIMDAQLRYWATTRVVDRMGASTAEHIDEIAWTLNEEPDCSRYDVLAHTTTVERCDDDDWLFQLDQVIKHHHALAGHELLGHIVFDPTGYFSTVPRHSFRDYPSLGHLPRAASFAGPHAWSGCPCGACVQHDELLEQIRSRSTDRASSSATTDKDPVR